MKTKITFLLIAISMIDISCSTTNDSNKENIELTDKKINAYILIPSTNDTLYYQDLSNKDFYTSQDNMILIKDILDNPIKYGLSNDNKYNDETMYNNSTGFLVKVAYKGTVNVTSKISDWDEYMDYDGPDSIYQVDGELTMCDGLMGRETDNIIINDCRENENYPSILLKRKGGINGNQLANISFMSAGDNIGITRDDNYYIVFSAKVFTQSQAWIDMFEKAINVDPIQCIQRLK